jgi:hypothetical protein
MTALAPLIVPLSTALLGTVGVTLLAPSWPTLLRFSAGAVLGPPLATLLFFLAGSAGVPVPIAGWGIIVAGPLLAAASYRRRVQLRGASDPSLTKARSIGPLVGAVLLLVLNAIHLMAWPAPAGDGLANFATKARSWYAEGTPEPFAADPRTSALHNDYPLFAPGLQVLGYVAAGKADALAGLSGSLLMVPAAVLFLGGVIAATQGAVAGWIFALLAALTPALRQGYVVSGYADPGLAAVLAVGAGSLVLGSRGGILVAALAAGVTPWIKLEGLLTCAVLVAALLLDGATRPRIRLATATLGGTLAAIWPATLLLRGDAPAVAEGVKALDAPERFGAMGAAAHHVFLTPGPPYHLFAAAGVLSCVLALTRLRRDRAARIGAVALAILVLQGVAVFVRSPSRISLEGDVFLRLLLQVWPLLLAALVIEIVAAARGVSRSASRPIPHPDPTAPSVTLKAVPDHEHAP